MNKHASPQLSDTCPERPGEGPATAGRVCAVSLASRPESLSPLTGDSGQGIELHWASVYSSVKPGQPPPSRCLPGVRLKGQGKGSARRTGGADRQDGSRLEEPGEVSCSVAPGGASSGPGGGGPGGYSRVRSYFHTPFASPRVRRSAPPPRPPPVPPGRRPFFTTSQRPAPAVIAAIAPTLPPLSATSPGFPVGVHAPRSATSLCRASRRVTPPQGILGLVVFRLCQDLLASRGRGGGRSARGTSGLLRSNQLPKRSRRRLLCLATCHGAPPV